MKEATAINPSMGWLLSITENGVWQLMPWAKRPFHRGIFVSWTHVAWASKQTAGGGTNKLVLLMIADATSHDSPMLVAKIDRLAKLCELNEKTVRNALRDLEERGLIGTVLRFFEGQQIANGYFLMGDEWVGAAKERIRSESHRDGYSCRLKSDPEHCSNTARTMFERGAGGDAALGRAEMPGGAGGDAGQIQPSLYLPSFSTEFPESFATLTPGASAEEQQSEGVSDQSTVTSQPQASALPPAQQPAQQPASPAQPVKPRARGKFVPPTEDEWLAYCKATFPTWKRSAALSVLAYYESVSWKGKSDWKACAKTCFHRARPWDLQEPVAQRKTMTPLERQKFEEEQAKNYVPML